MAALVDLEYAPSREDLLPYEDSRFLALLSGIPNSYPILNDSLLFGSFLRALAQEMARLEYCYAYDLVGLDPQNLTPPDIKRRFAAPLDINKSFPTPAQTDQDYRTMLVNLINAHKLGGTVAGIEAVIFAMTGQKIPVIELYKLIGNGIYDQSDRNTLLVTIPLVGADPLNTATTASRVEVISRSLYAAIDLIKPAHVGINYSVSVGSDEDFGDLVTGIVDTFLPHYMLSEPSPLNAPLTLAPLIEASSPTTTLAGYGVPAGEFYPTSITPTAYAALPGAIQFMFRPNLVAGVNSYLLNPVYAGYILYLNSSEQPTGQYGPPTGDGVLSPKENNSWIITSDTLSFYEL